MPFGDGELDAAIEVAIHASHCACTLINAAMDEQRGAQGRSVVDANYGSNVEKHCNSEMLNYLKAGTPNFPIISRLSPKVTSLTASPTWVVDPMGGASVASHGLQNCVVSIALVVDLDVVLGVVSAPMLGEMYMAVRGRGAFCNGQRIHVSTSASTLVDATVICPPSSKKTEQSVRCHMRIQQALSSFPVHSIFCHSSVALDMCFVAAGKADIYFEANIQLWDFAAGIIIVKEAGGVVHDVESTNELRLEDGKGICCGNQVALTSAMVSILKKHQYGSCTV